MSVPSAGKRVGFVLSWAATLLGLVLGYRELTESANTADARFAIGILAVFAFLLLIYTAAQEFRLAYKARYAEALPSLNLAYGELIKGADDAQATEGEIVNDLTQFCDHLASAYGLISTTRCRACVKVLTGGEETARVLVNTLCRDRRSERRDDPEYTHALAGNTDFRQVFKHKNHPTKGVFFENSLPSRGDYMNTSDQVYGEATEIQIPLLRGIVRSMTWKLPYRSTVVAPVYPLSGGDAESLLGFLCVDSSSRYAFRKRYDRDIIRHLAAGLHPTLRRWTELLQAEAGESASRSGDEDDGEEK